MSLDYWNGQCFYPASCSACIVADGNTTDYHKYQLEQDTNIRMAYISSKQDETFAALTQGGGAVFEAQLIQASDEMNAAFPDRFNSLIIGGKEHTFLISRYTHEVASTTVREWIEDMLEESDWMSKMDE